MKLRPGLLFFLQFAVLSAPGRFSAVWLASLGLSQSEVGFVLFLPILVSLLTLAPLGAVADSIEDGHRRLLIGGNFLSCVAIQSLGLALIHWQSHRSVLIASSVLFTVFRVVRNPVHPILDAYTLEWLDMGESETPNGNASSNKERYGRERMMGAISMGVTSVGLGFASDLFGFSALFAGNFVATVLIILVLAGRSTSLDEEQEHSANLVALDEESCQDEQENSIPEEPHLSQERAGPLELITALLTNVPTAIFFFTCASISVRTKQDYF